MESEPETEELEYEARFAQLAVERGFCTQAQIDDARFLQEKVREEEDREETLEVLLVQLGHLTPEQGILVARLPDLRPIFQIAGYEIYEKVGQGGMGAVFRARQVSLDRIVALKVLSPKLAADEAFCERFVREARSVAKLSHPNIIIGIDVGRDGKYFYFAMEFVEGDTALKLLNRNGPFTEGRALRIAVQIARALEHAHRHGLVHRDVKPDNIMVTPREEAKLCDLGLAKKVETESVGGRTRIAMGTPHYMAPEQARGETDVDIRADIYSLGASLYHMTTGHTLYKGHSSRELMLQHLTHEAPGPRTVRPELSEPFCGLLEKMLAKDRQDRYQSPTELIQDLEGLLKGQPLRQPLAAGKKSSVERLAPRAARSGFRSGARLRTPAGRGAVGRSRPADHPEPTRGPQQPVGVLTGLALALTTAALVTSAGLAVFWAGGLFSHLRKTEAQPVEKPAVLPTPKDNPLPIVVRNDSEGVGKKVEEPKKNEPPPSAPPSKGSAIEAARQARKARPAEYAELLRLYDEARQEAEKGAPPDVVSALRQERMELLGEFTQAVKAYLQGRKQEAQKKVAARDFAAALALFQDAAVPPQLRSEVLLAQIPQLREEIEAQARAAFETEFQDKLQRAGAEAASLKKLQGELPALAQQFGLPAAPEDLAKLTAQIAAKLATPGAAAPPRRAEPEACEKLKTRLHEATQEQFADAKRQNDAGWEFDLYYREERYAEALAVLDRVRAAPGLLKGDRDDVWIALKTWETELASPQKHMKADDLKRIYQEWLDKAQKRLAADPETVRPMREKQVTDRQEYFKSAATLAEELQDLELKGDRDPQALFDLAQRFSAKRPEDPRRLALTLYRLREWYPDFPQVKSGEVQWLLVQCLANALALNDEAFAEASLMLQRWPDHAAHQSGDLDWLKAWVRLESAKGIKASADRRARLGEARGLFLDFKTSYPNHTNNQKHGGLDSTCVYRLRDINNEMQQLGGRGP